MFYTLAVVHLLANTAAVNLGGGLGELAPGEWLLHDLNAFEIGRIAPRTTVKIRDHGWGPWLNTDKDGTTLIMRSGAIGDLLMLTPALAALKFRTGKKIAVCCWPMHFDLFVNNPLVDEVVPYPLAWDRLSRFSEIIDLGNSMEIDHEHQAQDVFAKCLGVPTPLADYRPHYTVTPEELENAKKHLFANRPTLAVQPAASIPNRSYPADRMFPALFELEKRGWGIVILGRKGQIPEMPPALKTPYVRNLSMLDLPLRESVAVLAGCDAFLGPDSSFMHFAAALDVPAVSLHGPFPWQIRTKNYPKNTALSGVGDCAGCCWHMHAGQVFPPNKPCTQTGRCVVLASIDPERIVAKIDALK